MPSFSTEVPHTMGKEKAVERLKGFVERLGEKFKDQVSKMDGSWNDNTLNFSMTTYGMTISGAMTVEEAAVKIEGQLPFAALAFRGKIEQSMHNELEKALSS